MNIKRSFEKRFGKLKLWLWDKPSLKMSEDDLARLTCSNASIDVFEDRLNELAEFYQIPASQVLSDRSDESKIAIHSEAFSSGVETDTKLLNGYRQARYASNTRHMLAYTRFKQAVVLLRFFNSLYPPARRKNINVLDYGCGVSDYGLAFAVHGYNVTISDIEGGNLDFAKFRYQRRKLPVQTIAITESQMYPDLGNQQIVLSGEVLEHIRNPVQLLKNIKNALSSKGYLWHSGYPEDSREVGGSHLQEAADLRDDAIALLREHFVSPTSLQLPGYLYKTR